MPFPSLATDSSGRITHAVDRPFTYAYAQPDSYHFCLDSILTPVFIAEWLRAKEIPPQFRALDVCAGCGVMGFELAHFEPRIKQMDFIEIQGALFRESFATNHEITGQNENFRFLEMNFSALEPSTYDLIIANPPYFFEGEGKLSPVAEKNRCRFFLDGSFEVLIRSVFSGLKVGGSAFILMKSGERHGRTPYALTQSLLNDLAPDAALVTKVADIRGTDLVQIIKQTSPYSCQR